MSQIISLDGDTTPAQLLRDCDKDYPNAKAMIVLIQLQNGSIQVRAAKANTAVASWMREVLGSAIRTAMGR